jgi:fructosamine-3-kinase
VRAPPFVKRDPAAPPGFFEREATGLAWLAEVAGGVPVVDVLEVDRSQIVLERLHPSPPSAAQADELGRRLARTHLAPAQAWGRDDGDGFIGPLTLPNGPFSSWVDLWWRGRVEPYLRMAVDGARLDQDDAHRIERVVRDRSHAVEATAPGRVHGDLWSGNVVWTPRGAVVIDAASAHGGHPEADLAMLALFGLPYLNRVLAAYDEINPLADGWRERVPLLQTHPLLVHVVLFGGSYVEQLRQAARSLG